MGHPDWGYDELEPLFAKSEHTLTKQASRFRGKNGKWIIRRPKRNVLRNIEFVVL